MDKIYKVVITGYVIQKEYMDEPEAWDWGEFLGSERFVDTPEVTITEMVEEVKGEDGQN